MEFIKTKGIEFDNIYNLTDIQYEIISKRINNNTNIEDLLNKKLNLTKDLHKLKDLDKGGKLLKEHIDKNSKILIVSDYDSDGINSAIVLEYFFKAVLKYSNIDVFINRRKHGNGFNKYLTEDIIEYNPDLIITSDHGSSDNDSFKLIKDKITTDIILTDHHIIPKDNYPNSVDIFINNQREDSEYSKEVSGCFIAFLLTIETYIEIYGKLDIHKFYEIIPNVAISTISDVMSLLEPINRKIVNLGINIVNSGKFEKWKIFNKIFDIHNFITNKNIGWNIAPVINTGNRVDEEQKVFDIMSELNTDVFIDKLPKLLELNKLRKKETRRIMSKMKDKPLEYSNCVIIDSKYNINGIIANNLANKHNKPTICFSVNDDIMHGSGRSAKNINLHKVISDINNETDMVIKYGGHYGAVGLTISKDNYDKFIKLFDKYVKLNNVEEDKSYPYDIDLPNNMISYTLLEEINHIGPYGKNFEEPLFRSKFKITKVLTYDNFAKLYLKNSDGNLIMGMYYYNGEIGSDINNKLVNNIIIDTLYTLDTNAYISNTAISLNIKRIRI